MRWASVHTELACLRVRAHIPYISGTEFLEVKNFLEISTGPRLGTYTECLLRWGNIIIFGARSAETY